MSGGSGPGGIRARRIDADNVVSGVQIQGGDPQAAAQLVSFAQAIRSGEISADEIKARSVVTGLQYIADPTQATPDDLRREVATLRAQLQQAIAAGELDHADGEDAEEALAKAEAGLEAPQPQGSRVVRKLDEASEILTRTATTAEQAGKVGGYVLKLAPYAATLWKTAQGLFGS